MKSFLPGAVCAMLSALPSPPAAAAFIGVLPLTPGGTDYQAYYDDQLDITWAANASLNGADTWDNQMAWVAGLSIGGVGGWRLPNMDVDGDGTIVDCTSVTQTTCKDNEYGHLFAYGAGMTLGGGITTANPGPFSNVDPLRYWAGTGLEGDSSRAWFHTFNFGVSGTNLKTSQDPAWAVHAGNVSAIPVPATLWLLGSGLLGLAGMAGRKSA